MNHRQSFFLFCEHGNLERVTNLVKKKLFDINIRNENGWTGLIIACFNSHIDVASFLILNGANVNAVNDNGTSVFMYAKTPVLQDFQGIYILDLLIRNGAEINHLDRFSKTVLDYVRQHKNEELSEWLVSKGAKFSYDLDIGDEQLKKSN
jgi:ankyrin repeat protein